MRIRKLDFSFYSENNKLYGILDGNNSTKTRGYGIVIIQIWLNTDKQNMTWGIPLHSNLKNKACFELNKKEINGKIIKTGLNYSKAVLIHKNEYISNEVFKISNHDKNLISRFEGKIVKQFARYVERYISACKRDDKKILNNPEYKFSTLCNYKIELGIQNRDPINHENPQNLSSRTNQSC